MMMPFPASLLGRGGPLTPVQYRLLVTGNNGGTVVDTTGIAFLRSLSDAPLVATSPFASTTGGGSAAAAFDSDRSTRWQSGAATYSGSAGSEYVGATFPGGADPVAVVVYGPSSSASATFAFKDFAVQCDDGSAGASWRTIWSVTNETGWELGERRTFIRTAYSVPSGLTLQAGYETGDGSGTNTQVCWTTDHDSYRFKNNSGAVFTVTGFTLLGVVAGSGGTAQLALYADDGTDAGALLGVSNTFTVANGTNNVPASGSFSVPANGAKMWLALRSTTNINCDGGNPATTNSRYGWKSLAGTTAFTDPFGSATLSNTRLMPAYVTGTTP